jgi:hypothetical protein
LEGVKSSNMKCFSFLTAQPKTRLFDSRSPSPELWSSDIFCWMLSSSSDMVAAWDHIPIFHYGTFVSSSRVSLN